MNACRDNQNPVRRETDEQTDGLTANEMVAQFDLRENSWHGGLDSASRKGDTNNLCFDISCLRGLWEHFFFFYFLVVYWSLMFAWNVDVHINSKWLRPKWLIDSNSPIYPAGHKVIPKRIITVALVTINSVHYLHFSGVDFCIDSPGLIFSKNSTRKLVKRNKPAMI